VEAPQTGIDGQAFIRTTAGFGHLAGVVPIGDALDKFPQLHKTIDYPDTGLDRGMGHVMEGLVGQLPLEDRQHLLKACSGLTVGAEVMVDFTYSESDP
jgi:hypothetical protein